MSVAAFEPTAQDVWSRVVERAREELPSSSFNMWFSRVRPAELKGDILALVAPSDFVRDWLARNYLDLIQATAQQAIGKPVRIELNAERAEAAPPPGGTVAVDGPSELPGEADARVPGDPVPPVGGGGDPAADAAAPAADAPARPSPPDAGGHGGPASTGAAAQGHGASGQGAGHARTATSVAADPPALSPFPERYTFESFVPGRSNRFAHAAALAVAEAPPSKAYNPLFIYGGVGLGKTHLLYAIGHYMTRLNPGMRCKYVTSETFVTEFIKAVRERQAYQFQRKYRDVDLLMVDDIQFLVRAEETQQEFFHTFNFLHASNRQIVIASDRPPQDLAGMAERLINRFRWGLSVDVQPPDLETRIAILQLKARRDHISVPDDVITLIATKFEQNIRELEGALLRVAAFGSLLRQPVTPEIAEQALADLIPQTDREIPAEVILAETASYFALTRADLVGKSRSRPLTTARHVAMYLVRECTGLSLLKIGELFDRDHTTVMHGLKKVETLMKERGGLYRQVQDLTRRIRSEAQGK
jgi:chromosomal replication initiator protein